MVSAERLGWPGAQRGLGVVAIYRVVQMFQYFKNLLAVSVCTGMAGFCLDGEKMEPCPWLLRIIANESFLTPQETHHRSPFL